MRFLFKMFTTEADGRHIVSRDEGGNTIIWSRENRAILWQSKNIERDYQNDVTDEENGSDKDSSDGVRAFENEIADEEAETIIRSCGQQTPHLWPNSFPSYSAELYCEEGSAYSNLDGEKTFDCRRSRLQLDVPHGRQSTCFWTEIWRGCNMQVHH